MQIFIGKTNKARNSTKQVTPTREYECLLKEPTNIIRPRVTLKDDNNPTNFNYAYIPEFGRYYYVVNWISLNAHMWELQLEVDVLCTYREHILSTNAFVQYAQSQYNSMLPDSRLPISDRCENIYYEHVFPPYNEAGSFIVNFASKDPSGNIGMAQSLVAGADGMKTLAQAFFDKNKLQQMLEFYNNPLDLMINCIWLPIGNTFVSSGFATSTVGDSDIALSGAVTRKEYGSTIVFTIELPYKTQLPDGSYTYADYRNVEPYTQYLITLPGVGTVEIPMSSYINDGSELPEIRINYVLSPVNGDITYEFVNGDSVIMMASGNLAVPVPLANTAYNTAGALQSWVGAIVGGATGTIGFLMGNPIAGIAGYAAGMAGMAGTFTKANQAQNRVNGNIGGFSGERFCEKIKVTVRPYEISDYPPNVRKTIGRPLYANKRLGDLSGFVKCTGAFVQAPCTTEEFDMLNGYLNNYATNAYGGIIIE